MTQLKRCICKMKKEMLSFVIPCYKSENSISMIMEKLENVMKNQELYDYEVILINDASPDRTYDVLKKLASENKNIKIIDLVRNFGQHAAIMAGYTNACGDIIIGLDDDGENSPEDIFKLINKLNEGYDFVCAKYPEEKRSFFRRLGTKINGLMSEIFIDKPKKFNLTSYYAMKRYILNEIVRYKNPYPYIAGLILRTTKNLGVVEIERRNRISGTSGYNLKKMISLWTNGFTAFSVKPLRIATVIGFIASFAGLIMGVVTIINKILNPLILSGYSSIMSSLWFLGGLILIMLGMIGEYIGRIYISINNSPQYVIKEKLNFKE